MWTISMISLGVLFVLCFLGVFHGAFKDNIPQRVAMGAIALAVAGRVRELWVSDVTDGLVVFYAGIAVYALGTMSKVIAYRGRERGWRVVLDWDHWLHERKTASGAFDSKPHHHV
jgi:hypothetical protein